MRRATSPGSTWAAKKITMLSSNSVIRPRPTRLARNRAMAAYFLDAAVAGTQAFWPAWLTSTWPIADTLTPASVGLVAER